MIEIKRKISIAITTFNRYDLLLESFKQVLDDDRVDEIVIVDDHSTPNIIHSLKALHFSNNKVKIFYNDINLGVYRNKKRSVELCKNSWVIVFDSDNILTKEYLDKLFEIENWDTHTIYLPVKAKPKFDYTMFSGMTFTKENIAPYVRQGQFDCMINCMNDFRNRDEYLKWWDISVEPISADSIYVNYLQLRAGNKLYVVPGLEYYHRVHTGSHYVQNQHRSTIFHKKIMDRLKTMH